MRKLMAPLAATLLALSVASTAVAASTEIVRDRQSGSEYDWLYSWVCGFDVWLTYSYDFTTVNSADGSYVSYFHATRVRTGPGGSIKQTVSYNWTSKDGFIVIGDPESGSWQEVIHEVLHGSRVWSAPGGGVVYRDAGYYDSTFTITITPDGETFEITDEVAHGQQPGALTQDELDALICATIG